MIGKRTYKLPVIFLFSLLSMTLNGQTEFAQGYKEGYKEGYCYQQGIGCTAPMARMAPTPRYPEKSNSYQDGYNRGFSDGKLANNKVDSDEQYSDENSDTEYEDEGQSEENEQSEAERQKAISQVKSLKEIYGEIGNFPSTIQNGWHNAIYTNGIDEYDIIKVKVDGNKVTEFYYDDFFKFELSFSGEIKECISIVKIIDPTSNNEMDYRKIYFLDYAVDSTSSAKSPVPSGEVAFYIDFNPLIQLVEVYIDGYNWGTIDSYFKKNDEVLCSTDGVLKVKYKVGKHTYYASNGIRKWEGEIEIKEGDCDVILLSAKNCGYE